MPTIPATIEGALFYRVSTLTLTPALTIEWPGEDFAQPASNRWLRVNHLPNTNRRLFNKGTDPHQRVGILQIDVIVPIETRQIDATELAGQVASHFPAGLPMRSGGLTVKVTRAPDIAAPVDENPRKSIPVSISYECFI
ncbi:DUF4128 domain-containing protein [Consotaella aegiceratis]|uniref:DUF4128 domain-containing protein n=1 Tax=Consotaella aegiceratis TaxID=3097961 RepID=UPI002F3EE5B8